MAMSKKGDGKAVGAKQSAANDTRLPPVIGALKTSQAADRIEAMGDSKGAARLRCAVEEVGRDVKYSRLFNFWDDTPPHAYTDHAFGFIAPPKEGDGDTAEIVDAGNIKADESLKNQRIKVTLDRLRVYDYPGKGEHTVLVDFYGRHQTSTPNQTEDLHFTQKYRALEGSGAGVRGFDIFVGLKVGEEGVSFKCYTVNVENKDDKKMLAFLDSDVFKKGLGLIEAFNPAIPVVSGLATGVIKMFAARNNNVPVQDFHLGLDFSQGITGARLRQGTYVAVQVPSEAEWDWSQWVLKRAQSQQILSKEGSNPIKLNYIVFRIDKM
jgi:hypothetical protein